MKTMNKILALALAFAMSLTLFASATFTDDADIGTSYKDSVNMLVELKVIGGYPDGSFKPQGLIKRSEFCKMAYVLKYGSDDQGKLFAGQKSNFKDVEGVSDIAWAKGYINYCASQKIISGVGANRFNPNGNITVTEAAKMLLVILGCDPAKEGFTGTNWAANVTSMAMTLQVFDGWVGNPTEAATRELIAKLMDNTIFAPVYIYSPITGLGSQFNAVTNEENPTLGQQTMKLQVITGIVTANENLAVTIPNRNDDEWFNKQATVDASGNITNETYDVVNASLAPAGKSVVNYEYLLGSGQNSGLGYKSIPIEVQIPDEYVGALVNIYCTGEGSAKYGSISNVKVIGNPILAADCVIAEANTTNIRFFPNSLGLAKNQVKPYVAITTVDGKDYKMDSGSNQRVRFSEKLSTSGLTNDKLADLFNDRFLSTGVRTAPDQTASYASIPAGSLSDNVKTDLVDIIDKATLQTFRFISFDGGNTFAYALSNPGGAGVVTAYNESSKSITISGTSLNARNLEDFNLVGEIAKDDVVVWNISNGKVNVKKADSITGKISNVRDGKGTIDGKQYSATAVPGFGGSGNVEAFSSFSGLSTAQMTATNTYYLVNGVIFAMTQGQDTIAPQNEYAVVMAISDGSNDQQWNPDPAFAEVRVKLGFADGTTGTYTVSKFYRWDAEGVPNTQGYVPAENSDLDSIANFNRHYGEGTIVRYKLNGTSVDLSGEKSIQAVTGSSLANNALTVGNVSYQSDSNSIVFVIETGGDLKVYRLAELKTLTGSLTAAAKATTSGSGIKYLLVGAIVKPNSTPDFEESGNIGYVLDNAEYQYDSATGKWYITVKLATKDGVKDLESVVEPIGIDKSGAYDKEVANLTVYRNNDRFANVILGYKLNDAGKLVSISSPSNGNSNNDNYWSDLLNPQELDAGSADGWFRTNIGSYTDTRINFYTNAAIAAQGDGTFPAQSALVGKNLATTYDVVTVSNKDQIGNHIITASAGEDYVANTYNAIVFVDNGKITKIFSIEN